MAGTCRTCGAAVLWAIMPSGKRMPFDPIQVDHGANRYVIDGDPPQARPIPVQNPDPGYVSHFATCPDAERHRRR